MALTEEMQNILTEDTVEPVGRSTSAGLERAYSDWLAWMGRYAAEVLGEAEPPRFEVDFRQGVVSDGDDIFWESSNPEHLWSVAEWENTRAWAQQACSQHIVCHSAALECRGKALLIVGESGAGKSTLTLELVKQGFGYLSDEYAIINSTTRCVYPYPTGVTIKNPSLAGFDSAGVSFRVLAYPPDYRTRREGALCGIPPADIVMPMGRSYPVAWILYLQAEPSDVGAPPVSVQKSVGAVRLFNQTGASCDHRLFHTVGKVAKGADLLETGRRPLEEMVAIACRLTGFSGT